MTEVELRDHVDNLLDGWAGPEIVGDGFDADDGFPDLTNNPEDPATLITFGFGDEEAENEFGFASTFGGTEIWRGQIRVQVWIEKDLGDKKMLEHIRDLRRTYFLPATANATNFSIGSSQMGDEFDSDRGFWAREVVFPYVRIDEPS